VSDSPRIGPMTGPDPVRALAEAVALTTPAPVTSQTELDRLAELHPELAAKLANLAERMLAEPGRDEVLRRIREGGEIRSAPSSENRIAIRMFDTDAQPNIFGQGDWNGQTG
jgi:hypothetical protein